MKRQCSFLMAGLLAGALALPVWAATEATLKKYAEAVDLLDRWKGDRQVLDAAHDCLTVLLLDEPAFAPAHVGEALQDFYQRCVAGAARLAAVTRDRN